MFFFARRILPEERDEILKDKETGVVLRTLDSELKDRSLAILAKLGYGVTGRQDS